MKGFIISVLALVAAPAFAVEAEVMKVDMTTYSGSVAARAVAVRAADSLDDLVARQSARCRLPAGVFVGNPGIADPANLDGVCISLNSCAGVTGTEAFTGATGCAGSAVCCIKRDCAGTNSNSACLYPDLAGDSLDPGQAGRFVAGSCPTGLSCFQLTRT